MKSVLPIVALMVLSISVFSAEPALLGRIEIPATTSDRSGEAGTLEGGIPANQWGAYGSGIAYLGTGNRYAMISDRGPADGATAFRCRFHIVEITVNPAGAVAASGTKEPLSVISSPTMTVRLLETKLLSDCFNRPLIGSLSALPTSNDRRGLRFDPEAIRATKNGTLYISDEYGPSIGLFRQDGHQIGQVAIPAHYLAAFQAKNPDDELPPHNRNGRQPNRGFECMAISPDNSTLYVLLQGPLIQDGALDEMNKRVGTNIRLLEIKLSTGVTREFLYQLDDPSFGCNEIECLAPGRFLVIERDSKLGAETAAKRIMEINLAGATDISRIENLPSTGTPARVTPVSKKVFIDLLDARWNLAGAEFPEKIEGIAIGPRRPDGSRLMLISSDNDFLPIPTQIFAFAVE